MAIYKGTSGDNALTGGAEDDFIYAYSGDDVLNGGDGNDSLRAGEGNDKLYGGAGNDYLDGAEGEDRMEGGTGNDIYVVDNLRDGVVEYANEGVDTVYSFLQNYTLLQNVEILRLAGTANINGKGNDLDNMLIGNSGRNALSGGNGDDLIDAGAGDDLLNGGEGNDRLNGNTGNDTVSYKVGGLPTGARVDLNKTTAQDTRHGMDTLTNIENVEGTIYEDIIFGNAGDNVINGLSGTDILRGGAGNDYIVLADVHYDHIVFEAASINGLDVIRNFHSGNDELVFFTGDGYDINAGFTAGATAVGNSAQFVWNSATRTLSYDADGAGGAAQIDLVILVADATLAASDIEMHTGSNPTIELIASVVAPSLV